MTERENTDCDCGCPMAIGVRDGWIFWRCMSFLCRGEYVTSQRIDCGDREPKRYHVDDTLKQLAATLRAGKSLVRRPVVNY